MLKYVVTAAAVALLSVPAYAAQDAMPPAAKVETAVPANAVTVTDWSQSPNTVVIDYTDLIGQPAWIEPNVIFFSSVMRADLVPPCTVMLPQVQFGIDFSGLNTGAAHALTLTHPKRIAYTGTLQLQKVRHVGDSRSPDGSAWRSDCWGLVSGSQAVQAAADAAGEVSGAVAAVTSGTNAPNVQGAVDRQRQRFAARRVRQW